MPQRRQRGGHFDQVTPYAPRPLRCNEIRVLHLLPGSFDSTLVLSLQRATLTTALRYEALSYCWGTQISPLHARVNGVGMRITENLDSALRHVRHNQIARVLWVDALCINQKDLNERGAQVNIMGMIYSLAQRVIIWLGPQTSEDHFDAIVARGFKENDQDFRWIESLSRIAARPWFSRVWVTQEYALSRQEPLVRIGLKSILWTDFSQRYVAASVSQMRYDAPDRIMIALDAANDRVKLFEKTRASLFEDAANTDMQCPDTNLRGHPVTIRESNGSDWACELSSRKAHFGFQLIRTSTFAATDARDKIFGLLGISSFVSGKILPDYTKSVEAVFVEATAMLLAEGHAEFYLYFPLKALRDESSLPAHTERQLPSWVPDFTLASRSRASPHGLPGLEAIMAARREYNRPMSLLESPVETDFAELLHQMCMDHPLTRSVAQIDSDMCTMRTHGLLIGRVAEVLPRLGIELDWSSPQATGMCALRDLYSRILKPRGISAKDFLLALLPPVGRGLAGELEADFNAALNATASKEKLDLADGTVEGIQQLAALSITERTMFVTENQLIGVCYAGSESIKPGDSLAGLFGINFPFLLRQVDEERHRIINVGYVSGHRWGHSFFGNECWKVLERHNRDERSDKAVWNEHNSRAARCPDNATWHNLKVYNIRNYTII